MDTTNPNKQPFRESQPDPRTPHHRQAVGDPSKGVSSVGTPSVSEQSVGAH